MSRGREAVDGRYWEECGRFRKSVEDIEKKVSLGLGKDVMRRKGEQAKWAMALTLTAVLDVYTFWRW